MANTQQLVSNKYQLLDYNYNNYYNNNISNNMNNGTLNRLVSKFGDIVTPKSVRNLQNGNIMLGFPSDPLKPSPVSIQSLSEQIEFLNSTSSLDEDEDIISTESLIQSIESTLKECNNNISNKSPEVEENGQVEVIYPVDLASRVADEIIRLAEDEPCGLRGCIIYINMEDSKICNKIRRLGKVRCDSTAVSTFEVNLNLKQDSGWARLLPLKGCWKKLKNKSVVISSSYTLTKTKLYRSDQ
ncbi:hypothetical protein CHUAL_002669 [Chamberlinius hualienensis]